MKPALSAAEHDARDRLDADLAEAWEAVRAAEAVADADFRDFTDGADLAEILAPVHAGRERERDIRDRLFALGYVDATRRAFPGSVETLHVGTRNARRGYGCVKLTHSIVIEPGRAPSPAELDAMADETVAALSGNSLPLAA